jgi:hypothetical protein
MHNNNTHLETKEYKMLFEICKTVLKSLQQISADKIWLGLQLNLSQNILF